MYISRVEIDIKNRQKIKDLTHVGAYHNWVEQCFPVKFEQKQFTRKLWRIDKIGDKTYLLIVSQTAPNISKMEKYGVVGTAKTKSYANFLTGIKTGMRARFRIVLNPVISVSQGQGKRGRVVPHVTSEQQLQFLKSRSTSNGFELVEDKVFITERGYVKFCKKNQKPIKLSKVCFEGELIVSNKEQFINTLTLGFGKKKAYGFGLMTIIPID